MEKQGDKAERRQFTKDFDKPHMKNREPLEAEGWCNQICFMNTYLFPDKQKLKEFITTTPSLLELLKEFL